MLTKLIAAAVLAAVVAIALFLYKAGNLSFVTPSSSENTKQQSEINYAPVDENKYDISLVASSLTGPSRVKITPDGNFLLVTQLTGEVLAFPKEKNSWTDKPYQLAKVETAFPGFPPEEAGLTGLALSSDFQHEGKIFLLYTFRDSDKKVQNRISSINVKLINNKLEAELPKQIFQANIEGNVSHQISEGIGIKINNIPHLMFLIGEGFKGERAQEPKLEAGKVMVIQEDGTNPVGQRPYPQFSKIQALGIRNAYNLAENPFDLHERFLIADTGPNKYDRIIYTTLYDKNGKSQRQINFKWAGKEEGLKAPIPDPNIVGVDDMVLTRLEETLTFTGLAVISGNEREQTVLATLFGKTGATNDPRGREIWIGKLDSEGQPTLEFKPMVTRSKVGQAKVGNPIGLEVDPQGNSFYFADILEGNLYQVKTKGGEKI